MDNQNNKRGRGRGKGPRGRGRGDGGRGRGRGGTPSSRPPRMPDSHVHPDKHPIPMKIKTLNAIIAAKDKEIEELEARISELESSVPEEEGTETFEAENSEETPELEQEEVKILKKKKKAKDES